MAKFASKISHLYIFTLIISNVIAYAVDSPLCGTMDGSLASNDDHKIYFKDIDHIITIEVNGQIIGCYSKFSNNRWRKWGHSFIASVKKCANKFETFCTNYDGYPWEYIEYLLQKHSYVLGYAFGSDNHYGFNEKTIESDLCTSHSEVIYPTSGITSDGTELYIFNTSKHKQGVMTSVCVNKGASCHESENFVNRTQCEQRFIFRELLALSPEGVPIKERFKFPSFCSCAKKMRNRY